MTEKGRSRVRLEALRWFYDNSVNPALVRGRKRPSAKMVGQLFRDGQIRRTGHKANWIDQIVLTEKGASVMGTPQSNNISPIPRLTDNLRTVALKS